MNEETPEPKKCWCGKDHTNDKPVNEDQLLNEFAENIRREIDAGVLRKLSSGEYNER
jgi:hypothetical protein